MSSLGSIPSKILPMTPYYAATILHMTDVDRSIQYYTDFSSFTLEFRYRDLAGLEYIPVLIYLSGPGQDVKKKAGQGVSMLFVTKLTTISKFRKKVRYLPAL